MHTIIGLLEESCRKFATRAALRYKMDGSWQEVSYGTLQATSDRVAAGLTKEGFKAGDHAALLAPSSPLWVTAYLGILKAGGIVIPVDKELKSIELRHILTDCEARVLFTDRPHLEPIIDMLPGLPALSLVVMLDGAADPCGPLAMARDASPPLPVEEWGGAGQIRTFAGLLQQTRIPPVPRRPDDTAVILYTSGTTGRSKGAMLSHGNIVSNIRGATAHLQVDETVHTLSFLPINHVFEQVCGVLLPLSLGGKVSFCESLKRLGDNLAEVKPTFLVGVPAVYRMILDRIMKNIGAEKFSRLLFAIPPTRPLIKAKIRRRFGAGTIFISGGAALDPDIAKGLEKLGLTVLQGYGITETSPVISAESPGGKRPGTVGRVLAGVSVRIDNPDEEMVGEILVKGPNVMQGYYRAPQTTAQVLADGWYRTGDLGRLDGDGFLTICGRVKNLIVTPNGRNVYPEEVENELLKSPYIAEALVYGHKTAPMAEEIHAMIYPDQEALADFGRKQGKDSLSAAEEEALLRAEVSAACERLADYKRVRRFTVRQEEFPKTTTRKIKRFAVESEKTSQP